MNRLIALALLISGITPAATIVVSTPQNSFGVGDNIPVDISISNVGGLYAFQFDVSFNPKIISASPVSEAGFFLANGVSFFPGTIDNNAGTISFVSDSLSGSGPGYTGSTSLAIATFTALAPGSTTISPLNVILLDTSLSNISFATSGATVSVSGGTTTPEPESLELLVAASLVGLVFYGAPNGCKPNRLTAPVVDSNPRSITSNG